MLETNSSTTNKNKLHLSLDLRLIIAALLLAIVGMLALWKPWNTTNATDRTVQVTGQATLKAEPDEYAFYPSYQFKNANKDTALSELTKKSDTIVAELKKLGVEDKYIKTNSNGYDYTTYRDTNDTIYTLMLTITVPTKELTQKVQDYLLTTSPMGSVSPQATFSDTKRKELENTARDEATKEARAKADQSAKNLGFKVGKVKSVSDGAGFGEITPFETRGSAPMAADTKQLSVQPGQNDLNYTVTVVYYVK
jgi:uncharacterized protein